MTSLPALPPNFYSTNLLDPLIPSAPYSAAPASLSVPAASGSNNLSLMVGGMEFAPLWGQALDPIQIAAPQNLKLVGSLLVEIDLYDFTSPTNPLSLATSPMSEFNLDIPSNIIHAPGTNIYRPVGDLITLRATSRSIGAGLLPSVLQSFKTFVESGALRTSTHGLLPIEKPSPLARRAIAELNKLYGLWSDGEYSDSIVSEMLNDHFNRFSETSHFVEFIADDCAADFTVIAIRCFAEVGRENNDASFREALLELTASPSVTVRYSAISALGLQIDQRVKSILTVRLASEKNKTVAALLSASVK